MQYTSEKSKNFYNNSYKKLGIKAQRRYPNEELCRFMGRNFLDRDIVNRSQVKILETGCGSGANIWMIAKEGFDAYGIDLAEEGILLAQETLEKYDVQAQLSVQDMCSVDFDNGFFDVVLDVFSSNCLDKTAGYKYLCEIKRILKPGGLFFSYFPSKKSDCYQFPEDASFIDSDTLNSISRKDAPFSGQSYPFRFIHPKEYENILMQLGFEIQYSETVRKTYNSRQEIFEFVAIEARKL